MCSVLNAQAHQGIKHLNKYFNENWKSIDSLCYGYYHRQNEWHMDRLVYASYLIAHVSYLECKYCGFVKMPTTSKWEMEKEKLKPLQISE